MKGLEQLFAVEEKQDYIFQSLLTRLPTDSERQLIDAHFEKADDPDAACRGLIWTLLNTQELLFVQ